MTFTEHYNERCGDKGERPLDWLHDIAGLTGMTVSAVYQWGMGFRVPNKSAQIIIASYIGSTVEELFPTSKNNEQ